MYLADTTDLCYRFDWAQKRLEKNSRTGYVFISWGSAISWKSQKQSFITKCSPKAEYTALSFENRQGLWYEKFMVPMELAPSVMYSTSLSITIYVFRWLTKTSWTNKQIISTGNARWLLTTPKMFVSGSKACCVGREYCRHYDKCFGEGIVCVILRKVWACSQCINIEWSSCLLKEVYCDFLGKCFCSHFEYHYYVPETPM